MFDEKRMLDTIHKQRREVINNNSQFLNDKLYLEFGTCHGGSMLEYYSLYKENNIQNNTFYGFDSFKGLPVENNDPLTVWKEGEFSTGGHINPGLLNKSDMIIMDGWFCDTLNDNTAKMFYDKKAGLIHIDCDIYTSTIEVLEFIVKYNLLTIGTIIVYDDWGAWRQAGLTEDRQYDIAEGRAHREICEKYNLNFELVNKVVPVDEFYEIATFIYRG
jgi:hypothetical protein